MNVAASAASPAPVPLPANETGRLGALRELQVLDAATDSVFDLLATQAALVCGVPMAAITLVDEHRQWFFARQGLEITGSPRDVSFCAHAILGDEVFEIADASDDARFARNPLVLGAPHIRFYAGAPVVLDDGHAVGTVCAIGAQAHRLDASQRAQLVNLARMVAVLLGERRQRLQLERELSTGGHAEHLAAQEALQASHEQLQVTLHSIGDAVITTDNAGCVQYLNPVAERLTGWSDAQARQRPIGEVFRTIDENTREVLPEVGSDAGASAMVTLIARHGDEVGIEQTVSPILAADGRALGAVRVFRDVTDRRRTTREMSYRATHDALTGLVNRSDFEARLQHTLRLAHVDSSVHALMYIDLDQFKLVNDACGHAAGDQLLRQVAEELKQCIRARDTLARLGGDEFGVILQFCSLEQGQRVAQQICDRMDDYRFVHGERGFRVGASIGLVPLDNRWPTPASVLQAADAACYAAKGAGRNRVHAWFDADAGLKLHRGEIQWVASLEQAMAENRFELFAQRVVPIAAPSLGLHCEVLLRLRGPDGQLLQPGAFLPAAERFQLASRIDLWVVRSVIEWMALRRDELDGVHTLAVNISGQAVSDPGFLSQVAAIVRSTSFDARKLCLELTETAAITNMSDAKAFVDAMRDIGLRFALDDFGVGASGFGYLKTLKVDYLKIDGQFIRDLQGDMIDRASVQCFCDVAAAVGTKTIAEFVEDDVTAGLLREIGVDYGQGYFFHQPEPIDALLAASAAGVGQSLP